MSELTEAQWQFLQDFFFNKELAMGQSRPPQAEAARRTAYEENMKAADAVSRNESGPVRELYWEECGIEQKVERARDSLLRMEHLLEVMSKRATEAIKVAKLHDHDAKGTVMMPAMEPYGMASDIEFNVRGIFYLLHGAPPELHGTATGSLRKY